jgi:phosphate/sulfate permease
MATEIVAHAVEQTRPSAALLGMPISMDEVVVCVIVVVMLALGTRAKYHRRQLNRAYSRAMSYSSPRKQLSSLNKLGVVQKAAAAKRANWTLRKAIAVVVLIAVIRIWLEGRG